MCVVYATRSGHFDLIIDCRYIWQQDRFALATVFIDRQTVGTSACSPLPSKTSMAACSMPSFCLLTPHSGAAEKQIYSAAGMVVLGGGGVFCAALDKN